MRKQRFMSHVKDFEFHLVPKLDGHLRREGEGVCINIHLHRPSASNPPFSLPTSIAIYSIYMCKNIPITYDHRLKRTGYPVRSGVLKLEIG